MIITLFPFVFIGAYFYGLCPFCRRCRTILHRRHPDAMPGYMLGNMGWLFLLIGMAMLISFGLLIYYVVHAVNNKKIDSNERLVWISGLYFCQHDRLPDLLVYAHLERRSAGSTYFLNVASSSTLPCSYTSIFTGIF